MERGGGMILLQVLALLPPWHSLALESRSTLLPGCPTRVSLTCLKNVMTFIANFFIEIPPTGIFKYLEITFPENIWVFNAMFQISLKSTSITPRLEGDDKLKHLLLSHLLIGFYHRQDLGSMWRQFLCTFLVLIRILLDKNTIEL